LTAEEIQAALDFWKQKDEQETTVRDVVRMALGAAKAPGAIDFAGVRADGWVADFLDRLEGRGAVEDLPPPPDFHGQLRPYQGRGYSWLAFLGQWGLGACLADDMGLGKTVQTLALIQREWKPEGGQPWLLICPTSVVGNWQKEAARFTPGLPVLVHHGLKRVRGEGFRKAAAASALVLSSYSLLHRDREALAKVPWAGVILDEAQNIKNPETKQAQAARALPGDVKIALTGTPVENHVGDLWSIMEFLNPGFLGSQASFKRNFFVPIQAHRDAEAVEQLRRLTGPFVLRRLKTDKSVIADLPEKMEMKVYCTLTKEQASLYEAVVRDAGKAMDAADGIQWKGVVLATLSKLKQVCNHPAHFLGDNSSLPGRSGKLARLTEMLEEVLEAGDRALVFTQFSEMGGMIQRHLQETYGREVPFLHGEVSKARRDEMVERFQKGGEQGPRIFVLSLKAGGTGLNLTAANHVFHFDRWWNPAVENQATDRAFRIGQTKDVQVHKFLCVGTLEERIDDMIENKQALAGSVVGTGEAWLTELSTAELKELFALRKEAVAE
jgi:SNF2 family DNA or RNA helicase